MTFPNSQPQHPPLPAAGHPGPNPPIPNPHIPNPHIPAPLDRILHALHAAEPTPGFAARLHASLEAAASTAAVPTPRRFHRPWTLLSLASLATAAILLLAILFHPHPPAPPPSTVSSVARPSVSLPPASPSRALSSPLAPLHRPRHPPAPSQTLTHTETVAQLETAAPSHPPPPLPFTPAERNIARFRSLHTAVSLAALSPAAVADHHTADQRDLDLFFNPPSPTSSPAPQEN